MPIVSVNSVEADDRPTRRDLWLMALAAIVVRLLFVVVTARARHLSLPEYASVGDGHSYLDYARLIGGERKSLDPGDERLFPGFPALIALLHLAKIPLWIAALGLTWLTAGISAAAGAELFRSRRVGWALVFLIPDYVLITAVASTEGPVLALTLLGLLVASRGRGAMSVVIAGLVLGVAGVVRPMACFAVIGYGVYALTLGQPKRALAVGLASLLVVSLALLGMHHLFGDALVGTKAYARDAYHGQLFSWPFASILMTPRRSHVPLLKVGLVWGHVLLALTACALLAHRAFSVRREPLDWLSLPWLTGLVIFNLCVGDVWGFQCFARFLVPALPALFEGVKRFLPRRIATVLLLGGVSFALALVSFVRRH